jgi:predicted nucleic-acid-binding protein
VTGLDANVLVRYITQDHADQAAVANRAIEGADDRGEKLLIQPLVLCETVWVLSRAYRLPRDEVLEVVEGILRTAQFEIVDKDALWKALGDAQCGSGDFAGHYIGRANEAAGADTTLTFDKALRGSPHFRMLAV